MKWKMNMKVELLATALFAVLTLQAVPVAVKGDFATAGADGLPEGWMIHRWDGFMPLAKFARVEADGKSVFRICEANGRAGAGALAVKREPCHAGDILRLRWSMRGKGKGLVRVQNYNVKGEANGGSESPAAELTESWKPHEFVYSIGNGPSGESVAFQVGLGCHKGAEVEFADVVCDIERRFFDDYQAAGKRAGDPEIITDIIAPGLLEKTKQGVYRTAATLTVPLGTTACALPALADVNPYLEGGFRLYSFGRSDRIDAQLTLAFASEKGDLTLTVDHRADRADLVCTVSEKNGARLEEVKVPYEVLPADFLVRASKSGDWNFSVRSLADSSTHAAKGKSVLLAGCEAPFTASLTLTKTGATAAEMTLDNLLFGRAALEMECPLAPCKVEVAPTFDPVEAGWPLVFADEFDGDKIDETKWFSPTTEKAWQDRAYVKDGILHILADWDEKHEQLTTASLWSARKYGYGYFEAKLRFTTKNGWWAAFWLYGTSNGNPFVDGFEIDIFEDYYTRDRNPQAPRKGILDHNLHILNGTYLKSWNYNSKLPGSLDEFYRLGCKWTPFEISYYLNGKLIASKSTHSGYNSVTFDAVQHATGIVPLHAIVSGQIMRPGWAQYDKTGVTFPDDYAVDYVRIYAYPDAPEQHPSVRVTSGTAPVMVTSGSKMTLTAEVRPATKTASPVKTVYLFDNGYLLDYKTQAPYTFDVTFSKEYFGKTRFGKPGRSGKPPAYDSFPHVFTVFAQDAEGRVGRSETFTKIVARMDASQPYEGVAQKLPGALKVGRYDAGGPNVAYWDGLPGNSGGGKWRSDEDVDCGETWVGNITPGEWLTYSVDVERTGTYVGRFCYGTPDRTTCALQLLVDGKFAGRFACHGHDPKKGWASDTVSTLPDIRLTAGRHRLTIVCEGRYNFTGLEFVETPKPLKVLMIGNSFTESVMAQTPKLARASGLPLDIVQCGIGGCPLSKHWANVEKASDPDFRPYGIHANYATGPKPAFGKHANVTEMLKADKWDIVTIQQASGQSAFPETYQPYADNLIAKIRELAPQAEIVIQETWSYAPYDARLAQWKLTPAEMYVKVRDAYAALAAKHGLRRIPSGAAVQLFRERLPVDYGTLLTKDEIAAIKEPGVIDFHGDVCGSSAWRKGQTWQKDRDDYKLRNDFPHLNARGRYLQACVWLATLFGVDPTTFSYKPEELSEQDAKLMRECARDAMKAVTK